ncbi:hypothetical protein GYMLUDRAFT_355750 [Collybiopsis luxurians FD-317 M1]|nr:hypothetical protein GYMLUDRAFT_355750 [Collybiopsis luxurians FD-317 M1]
MIVMFSSSCLIFYLRRSRTGLHRTDRVISRLMHDAVESASFASFCSIMTLLTFTLWPATLLGVLFSTPLGRVYTNTLLAARPHTMYL